MKKNALKTLALLLAAVLVIGSFAGCGQPAQEPSAPPESEAPVTGGDDTPAEPVTITFWHTYSDSEEAQLLDVVLPLWNELHPEITVEAVRQDSSQYHEMIVTSFGTGASPDVARVDIANIAAYAAQGGLVALSDYPDFAEISADYMEAPLSTNLYQGKYYGLPLDTNCKAAVVNMNVLAELGLDAVPETMEELIEAAAGRVTYTINVSGVGTMTIFAFQGFWEEYFTAKVLVGANEDMITLPLLLQRLNGQYATRWEWVFAASILALIPVIVLFIVFQKKMVVGGLTQGSVKG